MIWASWGDFFAMGGYALYVWGSVVVTFVFLAGEVISARLRNKAIRNQLHLSNKYNTTGKSQ